VLAPGRFWRKVSSGHSSDWATEELAMTETTVTTLRDVLGPPETWPDHSAFRDLVRRDMRGAVIRAVEAREGAISVSTEGAACGPTFTRFVIEDPDIRERALRVLRLGLEVHSAVELAI
jgi:hypothetical protein